MATSTPRGTRGLNRRRIALATIIVATLAATTAALALGPTQASASSDLELGGLQAAGVNETIDGNLTDIQVAAELDYNHSVPDASRRIVELHVGPSESELTSVAFRQDTDPAASDRGSVDMTASLFDADGLTASDFQPSTAESKTTDVVVRAVVEVRRSGGDPVRSTVTERVTVTLHDGTTLTAEVGGVVELTVVTDG